MKKFKILLSVVLMSYTIVGCGSTSEERDEIVVGIVQGSITEDECTVELIEAYFSYIGDIQGDVSYGEGSGDCNDYSKYYGCYIIDINGDVEDIGHCVGTLEFYGL